MPLIGRSVELVRLRTLLDDVSRGIGRVAVVEGEAGIGKTHLIDATLEAARSLGFGIASAAARDLERERPFGLVIDALGLRTATDDRSVHEIAALIADETATTDARFGIVERICDLVERSAIHRPLVVCLEDVHWADPSSLLALERLTMGMRQLPVFILCTLRPSPRSAALASVLDALAGTGVSSLILDPLDDEAVGQLVETMMGAAPSERMTAKIRAASGNPLFVTELIAALDQEGLIDTSHGKADVVDDSTPPSLALTILRRLAFLSEGSLETLRIASVLGASFRIADLCAVMGRSTVEVVRTLDEPTRAGLLGGSGDHLAFRHDLVRDAIYDDMLEPIRRALHVQAAHALASAGAPAAIVAAHASIGADVGDADAIGWLVRAAEEAEGRSPTVAAELLERAVSLAAPDTSGTDDVRLRLMHALLSCSRPIDAESEARSILAHAVTRNVRNEAQRGLFRALEMQGQWALAVDEIDVALQAPELNETEEARLIAARADAMHGYDRARARPEAERAIELGERVGDALSIFVGMQTLAFCNGFDGYLDEAIRVVDLAASSAEAALRHDGRVVSPNVNRHLYLVWGDRFDEATAEMDAAGFDVPDRGTTFVSSFYTRAHLDLWAGRWDDAVASAEASLPVAEQHGLWTESVHLAQLLAYVAIHRDELTEATSLLARIPGAYWIPALLAEAKGDQRELRDWLDAYRADGVNNPRPWHMSLAIWWAPDWVRLYLDIGDRTTAQVMTEVLEEASRRAHTPTSIGAAMRCRGLYDDDPERLLESVDVYRTGPRLFDRAQACEWAASSLARHGTSTDQAVALVEEALEVYESVGALRAIGRSDALLRTLGVRRGRRGPRRRPKTGWDSLTTSEVRICELVGEGLAYREIGERLFISRRTVETHIAHVFLKLGLSCRRELADAVRGRAS